jgi:gamma-glutamylcyclotransferase (GGCT)/AIG2-like uncharacterized protein YtfP
VSRPLFVYGTLLVGGAHAGLLRGLRRSEARVGGTLWRMPAGYPALQLGSDGDVCGDLVYAPAPRVLGLLDQYEGVADGLYRRVEVSALVGLLQERAWAYVMDNPRLRGGRLLKSGRWRPRRRT